MHTAKAFSAFLPHGQEIWECLGSWEETQSGHVIPTDQKEKELFWRWLNGCLPMESSEFIPCFVLLVWAAFAFPIKLSVSQSMSSLFYPSDSLPDPAGEALSEHLQGLGGSLGLNHNTNYGFSE